MIAVQILIILLVGAGLTVAGSQGGAVYGALPVFAICAVLAFAIQWLAFIPAAILKTERFYDLTGSLTYLTVAGVAYALGNGSGRAVLLGFLVAIWAIRLGTFLALRVHRDGFDRRFNRIKNALGMFFMTWTLQGLWVLFTVSCALAAMTSETVEPLGGWAVVGTLVWLAGFGIEAAADEQKRQFRKDPANQGQFISSGLWAWSRHPNYFGEIALWIGIACIAFPVLQGWQLLTLASPLFVYVLLTRISGINMLERRADKAWGEDAGYEAYKARTPVLVPRPPL
ncbi:MAG: DUF1295 domain-containing protein [Pseudomonadales bacterium]|nr:DUF1295 domain-containing protein [Pseudomonadales bacterium]